MKPIFFSLMLSMSVFAGATSAFSDDLICRVKVNTKLFSEQKVSVPVNASVTYADVEGFRIRANNFGDSKFEIEAFDGGASTRSYADASLHSAKDELKWTFWSRDILIESACRLAE